MLKTMIPEIKEYLDQLSQKYNNLSFIELDPISIPHLYTKIEDIEIAGFLSATLAWGQRKSILKSANQLMAWMDHSPHDFILNAHASDFNAFLNFKYRTFNGVDCVFFLQSLQFIYQNQKGLANVFKCAFEQTNNMKEAIAVFRSQFINTPHQHRSEKHLANTTKGSAAKRINMFLRWMVRNDKHGVDFGIWDFIPTNQLMIPLDVHSSSVAQKLGLLSRKQNDWRAVEELTNNLRLLDANDPIKYDFALFGAGVNGEI